MDEGDFTICGSMVVVDRVGEKSIVRLMTNDGMRLDDRGLVYGGYTFCLADYANMLTVRSQHPTSFLLNAQVRYVAPVMVGQEMVAVAELVGKEGRYYKVRVVVETDKRVFEGDFTDIALDRHVLDVKRKET
jgi:acyl-coenzyme A thioesterase PaaI-like protein